MDPELSARLGEAERLMKAVDSRLKDAAIEATELTIAAAPNSAVVLAGIVRSPEEKLRATNIAAAVPGVSQLVNSLLVIP